MTEFSVPRSNELPGIIPNASNIDLGTPGTREEVLKLQNTASTATNYLQNVQARTFAEIGNRPDSSTSNDLEEVQYTLTNWTSNGAKLVQDAGAAFNTISNDPRGFFDSVMKSAGNAFNAVKEFSENSLKIIGLTPEQIAQGGAQLLQLPILAQLGAIELMGSVISDFDKLRKGEITFEKLQENFEKKQKAVIEKIAQQVPQIAGMADNAGKIAGSLLKSVSDGMGLTEVWDGVRTGDFGKIGQGLGKFASEATGWSSMEKAWEDLKKGDTAGFVLNLSLGIGAMGMTASSVLTLGGSTVALLGTKAVVKGAMTTVTREGMEVVAKETGEKITQTVANELKEVLIKEVPKEMAEKAPQEMLEHVLKESGQEMFAGFKDDLIANLKNPEVLKKFDLPEDVLAKLEKGTEAIDEATKAKLDILVKETSKEATLKRTNELIEKLQLAEKLPDVTDRVVTELLTDLSSMSKKDLGKMFTTLLEKQGHNAKDAAKLGKEYAWRVKSALNGEKVDQEIIELLTDSIHKEFTAPIRESFEASLKEGMPKILDELNVHQNLREELTERWSKAAMEGFEEGLLPIRNLIKEGVERAVKRHRRRDDDGAAVNPDLTEQGRKRPDDLILPGKKKSTTIGNSDSVVSQSKTPWEELTDDEFWLKQGAKSKEEALRLKREELERAYSNSGKTTANKSDTTELALAEQTRPPAGQNPQPTDVPSVQNYQRELRPTPEDIPSFFKT